MTQGNNEQAKKPRPAVMIIDDDRLVRTAFARGLRRHYEVVEANNGKEALDFLATRMVDVVVTDLLMSGMDGRTFYGHVCDRYPDLAQRILFITGGSVNEESETFVRQMGDAVLVKPILQERLMTEIGRLLTSSGKDRTTS